MRDEGDKRSRRSRIGIGMEWVNCSAVEVWVYAGGVRVGCKGLPENGVPLGWGLLVCARFGEDVIR